MSSSNKLVVISSDDKYGELVLEGRAAVRAGEDASWRIGELSAKVASGYSEGKLAQYAADIGLSLNTLQHLRRAWKAFEKLPRGNLSMKAAKALAAIKDKKERTRIVKENPEITARQAEEKVREIKQKQKAARVPSKKKAISRDIVEVIGTISGMLLGDDIQQLLDGSLTVEERQKLSDALWGLSERVRRATDSVKRAEREIHRHNGSGAAEQPGAGRETA
jgi:hypothetical protein